MIGCKSSYFLFQHLRLPVLSLLILTIHSGCTPVFNIEDVSGASTYLMKVDSTINGLRRTSLVHIPQSYNPDEYYPLVVVVHGAYSTADKMEEETGFSELSDREGFVVLYPNGMGIFGLLQHWNAGHCCGKAAEDELDDVAFIQECIGGVSDRIKIDEKKVYLVGFSNGGMMAHRFAAEKSDQVAAFAALAASIGGRVNGKVPIWLPVLPTRPVPVMILHGQDDTTVPLLGGVSPKKGGTREYLSLEKGVRFWLEANGCSDTPRLQQQQKGLVTVSTWQHCEDESAVSLLTIKGWGHRWPGQYFTKKVPGLANFDAAELIWQFFENYTR